MRYLNKVLESLELSAAFGDASKMPLHEFLVFVLDALSDIPHVLVGGLALSEYAKPRTTHDLDFVVMSDDTNSLIAGLEAKGMVKGKDLYYSAPKRDIIKFEYRGREVDFLVFNDKKFAEHIQRRSHSATILGKSVKIASVEDLVITKLASMRWKDKADIMAIRQKSDALDLGYIRDRLWDLGISDRLSFLKLPVDE